MKGRRRSKSSAAPRWGRGLALTVAVIAAMSVGRVIVETLPTDALAEDPFVVSAGVDEPISLEYADVMVTDVQGAKFVNLDGDAVAPGGMWLIIDLRLLAKRHDIRFGGVNLVDGQGRITEPETRAGCPAAPLAITGIPTFPRLCFDVSPDSVAGSHLRLARGGLFVDSIGHQARDHVALIDLELSPAAVTEMQALETGVNSSFDSINPPSTKKVTLKEPDAAEGGES